MCGVFGFCYISQSKTISIAESLGDGRYLEFDIGSITIEKLIFTKCETRNATEKISVDSQTRVINKTHFIAYIYI